LPRIPLVAGSYPRENPCSAPQEPIALHPFLPMIEKNLSKTPTPSDANSSTYHSCINNNKQNQPPKKKETKHPSSSSMVVYTNSCLFP